MDAFKLTGYAQMRLVSLFEIVNQLLVVAMILGACGTALWLWSAGEVGVGAVAAVTASDTARVGPRPLGDVGMTTLFESVGTIQDGINTRPDHAPWWMPRCQTPGRDPGRGAL